MSAEEFGQRQTLDKQPPAVDLNGWYAGVVVTKLQSTSWEELRMVITSDVLVFGPAAEGGYDDVIPLNQIGRMQEISNNNGGRAEGRRGPMRSICLIFTETEGYNLKHMLDFYRDGGIQSRTKILYFSGCSFEYT